MDDGACERRVDESLEDYSTRLTIWWKAQGISARAAGLLANEGICSISALRQYGSRRLSLLRGFGVIMATEIDSLLANREQTAKSTKLSYCCGC